MVIAIVIPSVQQTTAAATAMPGSRVSRLVMRAETSASTTATGSIRAGRSTSPSADTKIEALARKPATMSTAVQPSEVVSTRASMPALMLSLCCARPRSCLGPRATEAA